MKQKQSKFIHVINSAKCQEDVWWNGGITPQFLTSAPYGGELSVSRPQLLRAVGDPPAPLEQEAGCPTVGLDVVQNKSYHFWESKFGRTALARRYSKRRISAYIK
jgi:hypothetical protein